MLYFNLEEMRSVGYFNKDNNITS